MEYFGKLGIIEPILKSIEEAKFERPTEIQRKAIPPILEGRDVIAGASTGSGKTLAFAAAIIEKSEKGAGIQALVLTPTRELAQQVAAALGDFSRYKPLRIVAVFGGVSINPQMEQLRTADVVVGTPGRILDHLRRGTLDLRGVTTLVLDEADRMLDMGFIDDVEQIIRKCPRKRQTLLFSATITSEVARLARRYMNEQVEIAAEQYVDPGKLTQFYYDVLDERMKFSVLVHLLEHEKAGLVMVFCNTRHNTDFVANNLRAVGVDALAIHGGLTQDKRNTVMKQFHAQRVCVLVCTDVAARGLDIPGISHVYNYDIPGDSNDYIHRIGRTARAGEEGCAISILTPSDYDNFRRVMHLKEIRITEKQLPAVKRVQISWKAKGRSRPGRPGERQRPGRTAYYKKRSSGQSRVTG
ncbi:MAG: DEAD/DEAH box helicase [Methanomicrobia archaeon]|nr:DEAD/DEAH box helicase [Methanomicrobia archaeon]